MSEIDRKLIFDAAKRRGAVFKTTADVRDMDAAIDAALGAIPAAPPIAPAIGRTVGPRGIDLMHRWESCKLEAYPDPGSKDGHPWTIGWGSTGPGIKRGTVWTQEQADARFAADLVKYADEVSKAIGDAPTDQSQFDALVSFHYNTGAIRKATLTKKHKAGDYAGAAAGFAAWIYNDGKVLRGLIKRRGEEAALYLADG